VIVIASKMPIGLHLLRVQVLQIDANQFVAQLDRAMYKRSYHFCLLVTDQMPLGLHKRLQRQ
jgi:hypothetical protein